MNNNEWAQLSVRLRANQRSVTFCQTFRIRLKPVNFSTNPNTSPRWIHPVTHSSTAHSVRSRAASIRISQAVGSIMSATKSRLKVWITMCGRRKRPSSRLSSTTLYRWRSKTSTRPLLLDRRLTRRRRIAPWIRQLAASTNNLDEFLNSLWPC